MQLVIDTQGASLRARSGSFLVSTKEKSRRIAPARITGILVMADCSISAQAIDLAVEAGVPILFFDAMGQPSARIWSARLTSHPEVRRKQTLFELDRKAAGKWAASLYRLKAQSQIDVLRANAAPDNLTARMEGLMGQLADDHLPADGAFEPYLMQVEAQVARIYWKTLGSSLSAAYRFENRSRRPAEDMFNAALNYLYGMLYNVVEGAVFAAGLDPYLGIVHADEYNKPVLAFDIIEPFRAWVDELLVSICREERLEASHFDVQTESKAEGLRLNKSGKRLLVPAFEQAMHARKSWQGEEAMARNHIFQYCGEFAQFLKNYTPNVRIGD